MGERKLFSPDSLRGKMWTIFGFEVDGNSEIVIKNVVLCNVCDSSVVYSGNATNLTVHSSKYVPQMGKYNVNITS
jgi:hypothetical protein